MRILVVIYEFPPIGGGGGYVARDICLGLAKRSHEVHVLTAHFKDLPYQENLEGVQVKRVPSARLKPYQANLVTMSGFVLAGSLAGLRYIRTWRPDIIHAHFAVPSGPVAWVLSRVSGIPYVLTAHLGDVPGGVPEKTGRWFRWIYPLTPPIWRNAAQVVAVSEFTRQLALRHYPVDVQIIPNGVNLEKLSPGIMSANFPPLIAFAGRFVPQKNPVQVVQTLANLQHLEWKCVMMGDGPLLPDVELEIKKFGLENRFILPGWITPEQVIEWLSKSDILFMPSISEGLPVMGVKALAKGLAIVASRIGGFLDLVESGENGYLIETSSPDGFTTALQELLTDTKRLQAFRETSLQKAQDFSIRGISAAYENLFLKALEKQ